MCICVCVSVCTHTMEQYSDIRKNEIMQCAATWMDLEKQDRERQMSYDVTYMCNLKK